MLILQGVLRAAMTLLGRTRRGAPGRGMLRVGFAYAGVSNTAYLSQFDNQATQNHNNKAMKSCTIRASPSIILMFYMEAITSKQV